MDLEDIWCLITDRTVMAQKKGEKVECFTRK